MISHSRLNRHIVLVTAVEFVHSIQIGIHLPAALLEASIAGVSVPAVAYSSILNV